jgi:ABC-type branched-subunit amino acid transport system permease subunit
MALPASVSGIFITLSLVGLEESSHGGGEFWLAIGLAALAAALTALGLAVVAGATGKPAFLVPPAFRD